MRINKQEVCFGCPCFNTVGSYCNLTDTENEMPCDTVLPNCPLPFVSVPEHHGDLIDRDKIKFIEYINGDVTVSKEAVMNQPVIIQANIDKT